MKSKTLITICAALAVLVLGVALGSVWIPPVNIINIIRNKAFGFDITDIVDDSSIAIVWTLRLPRSLLAFIVGAALSVSGVVMQSVLRNPLASSYTLGVSSGASLGACIILLYGVAIPGLSFMTLPLTGFVFGLGTILLSVAFASRIDVQMQNNTIILTGMVFSLFVNAITTILSAMSREHLQRLLFWQMGSFSARGWSPVYILVPIVLAGSFYILHYNRELDMMTFGEEQAMAMGVDIKRVKWILLIVGAALTGCAVAFVGVIGFVDLVAPHVVRKLFGSAHKRVIPMSMLFGGAFMVICDLAARTVVSPSELPVGAVTAIIGAPFFAYIYFRKKEEA